jgi:CDP-diacylglycerol---glycerol-3-phosphate 3-phosphatidyltransferase
MESFRIALRRWWEETCRELICWLQARGVTPTQLTLLGVTVTMLSAPLLACGWLSLGALVFALGTLTDALDGPLARSSQAASAAGGFLDSTMDRVAEAVPLAGLAFYLADQGESQAVAVLVVALLGSFLTSYIRARAEALGLECRVGLVTRLERGLLITVLVLFHLPVLMVWVLAVSSAVTAIHRFVHVHAQLRARPG